MMRQAGEAFKCYSADNVSLPTMADYIYIKKYGMYEIFSIANPFFCQVIDGIYKLILQK